MKKSSAKLSLKAMNIAVLNFAEKNCKNVGLSAVQTSKVLNNVRYEEAYMNIEVLKSGKIYTTAQSMSNKIVKHIEEQTSKE